MAKRRSKDLQVNLEPIIHQLVTDLAARMGKSVSGYVREMILQDLRDKGLLTDSMLAEMAIAR